ncbi:hypothetical protein GBA52_000774 [Prunus armeniaca]|nr:hypothetical protein GBA52_000774 [Prunus armeniaca]
MGCVDVPQSKKCVEEAIEGGKRISNIPVNMIYTTALILAQITAMLSMTQHRLKKVQVILHNETEQARAWTVQVILHIEDTKKQSIPVLTDWRFNERM